MIVSDLEIAIASPSFASLFFSREKTIGDKCFEILPMSGQFGELPAELKSCPFAVNEREAERIPKQNLDHTSSKILEIRLTISRHVDCLFWELGTLVSIQFKLWDWQGPDLPQTSASFGSLEGRGSTVERGLRPVVRSVAVAHRLLQLNSDYQPFNCQPSHSKSSAYLVS